MCDCWDIERGGTPIASTGGAFSRCGTTISGSIDTHHGQRGAPSLAGSEVTSAMPNTRFQTEAYNTSRSPGTIRGRRGKPVRVSRAAARSGSASHASGSGPLAWPIAFSQWPRAAAAGSSSP
jgi:hypothetical protein